MSCSVACPPRCDWQERSRSKPNLRGTAVARIAQSLNTTTEDAAAGIVAIANEHMARALRLISLERGHDPRTCTLVAFGGAGGLHVCALALALEIPSIVVPMHCGVFSAFGMLVADASRQLTKTVNGMLDELGASEIDALFDAISRRGIAGTVRRRGTGSGNRTAPLPGSSLPRAELHADSGLDDAGRRRRARSMNCTERATVTHSICRLNSSTSVAT